LAKNKKCSSIVDMLGKVIELYSDGANNSFLNPQEQQPFLRIGDWVEFEGHGILGQITSIERETFSTRLVGQKSNIKIGSLVQSYIAKNKISANIFGKVWGEFNANLDLLDLNFSTKELNLTGEGVYDFIPVVRVGEPVQKNQKLGYIELENKLKFWILAPIVNDFYDVKKIALGTFGRSNPIVVLETGEDQVLVGLEQDFVFDEESRNNESENMDNKMSELSTNNDYDFVLYISKYLSEDYDYTKPRYITYLTGGSQESDLLVQQAYHVASYLAYCGYKVLLSVDLENFDDYKELLTPCTVINFEWEKGSIEVIDSFLDLDLRKTVLDSEIIPKITA
jgi:biotin carboxyl carrier protein